MSDFFYDEVPVIGDKYKTGDWQLYAVHDDKNIKGFFGDYRWLSNFPKAVVYYEGLKYPSSENAYQAAKVEHDYRHLFQKFSSRESKNAWKEMPLIDDTPAQWDARKYEVMSVIIFDKFYRNKDLRQKLLDTGDKYLEETNHWKDSVWGVDIKHGGKNWLGQILMNIRTFWKNKPLE